MGLYGSPHQQTGVDGHDDRGIVVGHHKAHELSPRGHRAYRRLSVIGGTTVNVALAGARFGTTVTVALPSARFAH
ncbi:hypothetical protein JCM4914_72670 [Streptomyces platensis subsp. malvinus]